MRKQRGYSEGPWLTWEAIAFVLGLILLYIVMGWDDARASTPTQAQLVAHASKMEIQYELPPGLLVAICEHESRWRNVAGRHGEIGVCQVKPSTVEMVCQCAGNARKVYIRRGWTGDVVAQIQAGLAHGGFYAGRVDGRYGPATERAVRDLQRTYKAKVDGVVGPVTWALLFTGQPYPGGSIEAALWNPYKNIEMAAEYLVWLRENVSDDPVVLLAAYNGGPANPIVRYVVGVKTRMERHALKEAM